MEVHAHTNTPRKKWTHYLWEFLMLFLAVFCGFLAENYREHIVEHEREKQYMESMLQDLKQDNIQLKSILNSFETKLAFKDSLLIELANPEIFKSSSRAYYFSKMSAHFTDFIYTDRTIQQLKNSGGMRLIRNNAVADSIIDYDSKVRTIYIGQQQMNSLALTFGLELNKIFKGRLMDISNNGFQYPPVPLLTANPDDVEELYNNMTDQKFGFNWLKTLETDLLSEGERLSEFIKKEYNFE